MDYTTMALTDLEAAADDAAAKMLEAGKAYSRGERDMPVGEQWWTDARATIDAYAAATAAAIPDDGRAYPPASALTDEALDRQMAGFTPDYAITTAEALGAYGY